MRVIERMGHGFRGELPLGMQNPKPQLGVLLLKESIQCACCCSTTLLHVPRTVFADNCLTAKFADHLLSYMF